jgi:inhibitor of cysteine peptidase
MTKTIFMYLWVLWLVFGQFVNATIEDNSLLDLDAQSQAKLQQTFTFQKFSSCQDFESVIKKFVLTLHQYRRFGDGGYAGGRPMPMMQENASVSTPMANATKSSESTSVDTQRSTQWAYWWQGWQSFSQTNIQKVWVDEPEIIKTDGSYIYYYASADYNQSRRGKITIFKAGQKPSDATALKVINLPQSFQQVQMFLQNQKLIVIAHRYLNNIMPYESYFIDKNSKTTVIVYDVSNPALSKVLKIVDYDGNYIDARIVWPKLILASQTRFNRWPIYPLIARDGTLDTNKLSFSSDVVAPAGLMIDYTTDTSLQNIKKWDKTLSYYGQKIQPKCEDMMYILPSEDAIKNHYINPEFSIIHTLDLNDLDNKPQTKVLFGSTNQMHVSTQGIYLASPLNLWWSSRGCPIDAMCLMRTFPQSENTLIHKFNLGTTLSYVNSVIVPGQPLTQYSMDEDEKWQFRILTKTWSPQLATHLFVLDKGLNIVWSLRDIEVGEEFKSSRYIGDKLYLVTFKQIDPLFVIDIATPSTPKIIWELKIPGFSTYLHPYAPAKQGLQYMIWLGYDTNLNQWQWETTDWVKIDLYKIDYNTRNASGMVDVKQIASQTLWGKGSYSPALDNPRTFVRNPQTQQLILPLMLSYEKQTKQCTLQYDEYGKEMSRQCYPTVDFVSNFAGIKWFKLDIQNGISENLSVDYLSKLKNHFSTQYGWFQQYNFNEIGPRVWYVSDRYYLINRYFGHFFTTADMTGKYVDIK